MLLASELGILENMKICTITQEVSQDYFLVVESLLPTHAAKIVKRPFSSGRRRLRHVVDKIVVDSCGVFAAAFFTGSHRSSAEHAGKNGFLCKKKYSPPARNVLNVLKASGVQVTSLVVSVGL